ncbi:MAG TPA: alcohol dehydrogenase catalytic domain-containing protein [Bacteroidota bacterium]|nr:alcohol dehydrogenase catalytic domain-containing protein [Bacteroidota bacterium]
MKAITKRRPAEGQEWAQGFRLIDKPAPKVTSPRDVIIKVFAAAVCGTDVGIYNAKESLRVEMSRALTDPVTVGHEFSGRIVDAGTAARKRIAQMIFAKAATNPKVKKLLRGEKEAAFPKSKKFFPIVEKYFHASAEMHVTCGKCYQCRLGEKHVCRNTVIKGVHDDGAFAEYVKVPAENLVLFHESEIPLEIISFMDALGNATHTVMSVDVKGRNVVVLGCGVQGLMAIAVAHFAGARKIFVTDASHGDFSHEKLEGKRFRMARLYGATDCFDMAMPEERERFHAVVQKETDHSGVDAVFEMSGSYRAYDDAFKAIRMGGTFSLLGLPTGTMEVDFARDVIFKGVTIKGIIGRRVFETWDHMERILKAGLAKKFLKTGFITHQFPLESYEEAFDVIRRGDAFKVLLKP